MTDSFEKHETDQFVCGQAERSRHRAHAELRGSVSFLIGAIWDVTNALCSNCVIIKWLQPIQYNMSPEQDARLHHQIDNDFKLTQNAFDGVVTQCYSYPQWHKLPCWLEETQVTFDKDIKHNAKSELDWILKGSMRKTVLMKTVASCSRSHPLTGPSVWYHSFVRHAANQERVNARLNGDILFVFAFKSEWALFQVLMRSTSS